MDKIIIFGTNELSEIVTTYINSTNEYNSKVIGFVVDDEYYVDDKFCELPVHKYSTIDKIFNKDDVKFLVCIGYSQMNEIRKNIFYRLKNDGWKIGSFIDKRAIINTNDIGEGNIILDGVNIGVGSKIGNANIFYPCSLLSHHSSVGNFNYFSPRASIAGKVNIEDNCFFGINSTVRDNIQIASGALIGAGAYLDHNVCDSDKTIVPARSREINKMCSLRKKNCHINFVNRSNI